MRLVTTAIVTALIASQPASKVASGIMAADGPRKADATQQQFCNCSTAYRTLREWELHRPATPRERAETSRLNREFLEAARAAARANAPAPKPDAAQLAYQERLKNYRALTESYERRMRDYSRLHTSAPEGWQDAARADP